MMPINQLQPEPHPDAELIEGLEPDQTVASASKPLARMPLGPVGKTGLWVLRIFVLIVTAMVVYTFVVSLPGVR
jgi:hypothetical protein